MKSTSRQSGLSLIEVLAMVSVIVVIGWLSMPALYGGKPKAARIQCVNNLKNVGLAFRVSATDHENRYSPEIILSNRVPRAQVTALRVFLSLSNELSTPKIIFCPTDTERRPVDNFAALTSTNISYFVSLSASPDAPQTFLAGDRNLQTNGVPAGPGLLGLSEGTILSWSKLMHREVGDILMSDGSVQQFSSSRLAEGVRDQRISTNYLAIP